MASSEAKYYYDEKHASPTSSDISPVEVGSSSRLKRRLPKFSLEVRQEESSFAKTKSASNADFDPIPPSKRTWNWGAYIAYWMADAWAVSNWEVGEFPDMNPSAASERVALLNLLSRSFFHHRRWPRLEIRYWRLVSPFQTRVGLTCISRHILFAMAGPVPKMYVLTIPQCPWQYYHGSRHHRQW